MERFFRVVVVNILLLIVAGSWYLGGTGAHASIWMAAMGFLSLLVLGFVIVSKGLGGKGERTLLFFWTALALLLSIALFFPEYQSVETEAGHTVFEESGSSHKIDQLIPVSFEREIGLKRSGFVLGVLSLCLLLYRFAKKELIRLLLLIFFLNGLLLSVIGTANKLSGSKKILWFWDSPNTHFFSTFHYHNHWGAFCILSACTGLGLFEYYLRRRDSSKPNNPWFFFLFMSLFLLATLPLASGRISMLGGMLVGIALIFLALRKGVKFLWRQGGWKSPALLKAGILSLFVLTFLSFWFFLWQGPIHSRLEDSLEDVKQFRKDGGNYRIWGWRYTMDMAMDRPYLGWGLGSYKWIFTKFYAGSEFQKYPKDPPLYPRYSVLLENKKRTHRFRPVLEKYNQLDPLPEGLTYRIHYNRPLRFEWDRDYEKWRQHSTEITFSVHSNGVPMDERVVSVKLDEKLSVLGVGDDLHLPTITNQDFEAIARKDQDSSEEPLPLVGWIVDRNDRNTSQVVDFAAGKTASAGDGRSTTVMRMPNGGHRKTAYVQVQMGRYDSNSIWADYDNGPFFRLRSTGAGLEDGTFYTFMIRARVADGIMDSQDPPVLSLEIGPKRERYQEHAIAVPERRWKSYYLGVPYWDYMDGNFAIRRSSAKGKAAGAVLGIDDVEVFHHTHPGSIGVAASGQGTEKLTLNFFYKGIQHPVTVDAVKQGQGAVEKWANNHAHNDFLEFLSELGFVGCGLLVLPVIGFLNHVRIKGARSSISKWIFLGCFVVGLMALVDFPLQNPVIFILFSVLLTLAGKYSLIQGQTKRARRGRQGRRRSKAPA